MGAIDGGAIYYCPRCGSDEEYLKQRGEHPGFDNSIPYLMFASPANLPLLEREAMTPENFAVFAGAIAERAQILGDLEAIEIFRRLVDHKQLKMDRNYPTAEKDFQLYLRSINQLESLMLGREEC